MLNGVGSGGGFARDAIKAAMQRQAEVKQRLGSTASQLTAAPSESVKPTSFGDTFTESIKQVNEQIQLGESVVENLVTGRVSDFHEIAAQVKQADLSFKFALAVRNKFIDAYREVMRMSV